jgi:hypothetical protein
MGQICSTYIGTYLNGPHDSMQKPINQCNSKRSLYYIPGHNYVHRCPLLSVVEMLRNLKGIIEAFIISKQI